ncbi:M3 family metallopeptidase [Janthinobacterium sp.]|uniref:M3 family metallopeptidase n=1 Tax=Janthinobacterium sp. TaxID=1871054 RepID=UPI00293D75CF|nr:M3 family metallopeptidase [Janthinobacterium sp.]
MTKISSLLLSCVVLLGTSSVQANDAHINPLYTASTLQFEYPAFDKIRSEDFAPAFRDGMLLRAEEITRIANNPASPSFDNTVVAMERSGQLLGRTSRTFFNLKGTLTNPVLDALERSITPQLAAHNDAVLLNPKLFQRIKTLYDQRDALKLDAESERLLERYHTDFVRAGARLSVANQKKLKGLNQRLAGLETSFSQNVLNEINASAVVVATREELDGLAENDIQAAANAAKAKGLEGKYLIALQNTSGQPFTATLTNRALRKRLMDASLARGSQGGKYDNRKVFLNLMRLRAERAQLLGYANHAAYQLEDETAKTPAAVNKLLADLAPAGVANARKEAADLQGLIDQQKGGFALEPQDWAFYTEQLRKARYSFDEAQVRPYFELDSVLTNGVFYAASKLYGLSFKERKDLPVYHPTVRVFEVFDADGKPLALFLADMYARSNKQGGAWMNEYMSQSTLMGTLPVVGNHLNIPQPPEGQPTLMTWDEVRTAFHEFGHALHGMFSTVRYPRFAGTNVPRDFVEYPSQVNEMWAIWPEVLQHYTHHYQTGAPMPQTLVDKLTATATFNQGFAVTEYLAASLLDQRWHQLTPAQVPGDVLAFEATALHGAGVDFKPVPPRYRTTYFSHSAGGYSAGYYAYLWSEVLDADTVEWFKENGGLTRKNGDWFRRNVLSVGGSKDAVQAFRTFRGRDADVQPLLVRRGLVQ